MSKRQTPKGLTARAKILYKQYANRVAITDQNQEQLINLCEAIATIRQITEEIDHRGMYLGERINPLIPARTALFGVVDRLLRRLGLDQSEPDDEIGRFMEGN